MAGNDANGHFAGVPLLLVGLVMAERLPAGAFHDFTDRTAHLIILSLILIWFGVNQWRSGAYPREAPTFADPSLEESPLETGLQAAMARLGAGAGILVWRDDEDEGEEGDAYVSARRRSHRGSDRWRDAAR